MELDIQFVFNAAAFFTALSVIHQQIVSLLLYKRAPALYKSNFSGQLVHNKLARAFSWSFDYPGNIILNSINLGLSLLLLIQALNLQVNAITVLALLVVELLTYLRQRQFASANTPLKRVLLFSLFVHLYFENETLSHSMLFAQYAFLSLSYFFSAFQKLKDKHWLNGESLQLFAKIYISSDVSHLSKKASWQILSFGVIAWELCFFSTIWCAQLAYFFVGIGVLFHTYLAVRMGLWHFFFTFLSFYPAVLFLSQHFALGT